MRKLKKVLKLLMKVGLYITYFLVLLGSGLVVTYWLWQIIIIPFNALMKNGEI